MQGVTVDLAAGTGQGGHAEGDTLTGIEGLIGSRHADSLTGDAGTNIVDGQDGNDILAGGAGQDILDGGAGADMLDGGAGDDLAVYLLSDAGVTVNLAAGTGQGGHAEGDTLAGIENILGSNHSDHLIGDAGVNVLLGADGDDTLEGGAGYDVLDGGGGEDVLNGGAGADRLQGGGGADRLSGGGGDDRLDGGAGADVLDGGEDHDVADYGSSDVGVTINLATGTGHGGHAEGDTLAGIEQIEGSQRADHLTGDAEDNVLYGVGGNDTLDGGAGADRLTGGAGDDTFVFGDDDTITDFGTGGDKIDLRGVANIDAANFEANVAIRQVGDDVEKSRLGMLCSCWTESAQPTSPSRTSSCEYCLPVTCGWVAFWPQRCSAARRAGCPRPETGIHWATEAASRGRLQTDLTGEA